MEMTPIQIPVRIILKYHKKVESSDVERSVQLLGILLVKTIRVELQ
jgi:hypothetical protein